MKTATTEEWIEIGNLSKDTYKLFMELFMKVAHHVPKNSKVIRDLWKMDKAITEFLSDAENEMFRQHAEPDDPLSVFYGSGYYLIKESDIDKE